MQDLDRPHDALQILPLEGKDDRLIDAEDDAVKELPRQACSRRRQERTCWKPFSSLSASKSWSVALASDRKPT